MNHPDAAIQTLLDKQSIYECLMDYSRGVDRMDRALLLSVYHPDAIDDHSSVVGGREAIIDWIFQFHGRNQTSTQHMIVNHRCELEGSVAHCESYFFYAGMNSAGPELSIRGGRYLDRFEKREGKWAIAVRKVVTDWHGAPGEMLLSEAHRATFNAAGRPARDRSDPSYQRPLEISPERLGARAG